MSSLAGTQGSPKIATYTATKAFNTTFAEGLWKELKMNGIDVLASCAGAILTPGYKNTQHQKSAPGTLTPEQVASKTLNALGKGPVTGPRDGKQTGPMVYGQGITPPLGNRSDASTNKKTIEMIKIIGFFTPGFFLPLSRCCITYYPAVGWTGT